MIIHARIGLIGILILAAGAGAAEVPALQTPAPVIYLADNLDEADRLGWCIDTLGRGFAETLQAHSCKPQGGDVQFTFEQNGGPIRSVAFPDFCVEHVPGGEQAFALTSCDADLPAQRFIHDPEAQSISPADDPAMCMVVGTQSRQAGPFMSRSLELAVCDETPESRKEWVVVDG
ncbi:hypothetical protein [Falsirhodobacter algicola]|uniref:Ricin B lectin domain-containing protein n=1 Tax=Falsirhodobacter algicola TaxID=2692330 RepID=A0A8J8MTV3_9RHOB|nr:hypothetical protein [Falsirhodobacter algicola]QUS36291.1 hypothetical protein GR316_08420 [Falsirhodobacter algicola]